MGDGSSRAREIPPLARWLTSCGVDRLESSQQALGGGERQGAGPIAKRVVRAGMELKEDPVGTGRNGGHGDHGNPLPAAAG